MAGAVAERVVGRLGILALAAIVAWGCSDAEDSTTAANPQPQPEEPTPLDGGVHLPIAHDDARYPFSPSRVQLAESGPLDEETLARFRTTDDCRGCHADVHRQWSESAHGHSSFDNPWYRASIDRFREARGNRASRFCAGCHDPALLLSGAIDGEVTAETPGADVGIPCRLCHGTVRAEPDGNASYVWSREPIPLPDPANAAEVAAHRARVRTPVLESAALCGSCHRSFAGPEVGNPHHIAGIEDIGAFAASPFAGADAERVELEPLEPSSCRGCHMRPARARHDMAASDGVVASHRFAGAHLGLSSDPEQTRVVLAQLESAATVDLIAARIGDRLILPLDPPAEGTRTRVTRRAAYVDVDVVVRNVGVGHRFPGGTRDLQDTRVELWVRDARGRPHVHSTDDPASHQRLSSRVLDGQGRVQELHDVDRFVAAGFDRTLTSRDARLVRFRVPLDGLARRDWPLRFEARLVHRRHPPAFAAMACEASRSPRGRAFAANLPSGVDPCVEPPATLLARAVAYLGGSERRGRGVDAQARRPLAARLYDYALALGHTLQEDAADAVPVLTRMRAAAPDDPRAQAAALVALARIAGRQGRIDEALRLAGEAEQVLPGHPAIARARGMAYAQVWRWGPAAASFGLAGQGAAGDTRALRDWARALGSLGDDTQAWSAASRGLMRAPRDPALLRTQWLSLQSLEHSASDAAEAAFVRHRESDEQARLLRACEADPVCARDRLPIPLIVLSKPVAASGSQP